MNPFEQIALQLLAQAEASFSQAGMQWLAGWIARQLAKQAPPQGQSVVAPPPPPAGQ